MSVNVKTRYLLNGVTERMKSKILSLLFPIFATLISAVLLGLAFPWNEMEWLGWIAVAPLLIALSGRKPIYGYLLSLIWCFIFHASIGNWLFMLQRYSFLHHALFGLYLSVIWGLFGLTFNTIERRRGVIAALLATPFIWVSLEYMKSNIGFLSFPMGLLAHCQYQNPPIIQIASFTGTHGVSFLLASVNAAFAAIILFLVQEGRTHKSSLPPTISKRGLISVVVPAALLTSLTLSYGFKTISRSVTGEAIRVSVVQGNIEQVKKWDRKYAKFIMQTYANLTQEASRNDPALIIWPESATPKAISKNRMLYNEVRRIASASGTYLLLGSANHQKIRGKDRIEIEYRNSAFLIHPNGKAKNQQYDKIKLLPFGEYLPLKEIIPWSYVNIPDISNYVPGEEFTVFKGPTFHFAVTICWENVFPYHVRRFVNNGAQFIVNLTNEAWVGRTAGPYQFLSTSVFRAVENRLYVVRSANTGVSCFIDPYGRIVDRVKDTNGQDIFVRGVLTGSVIPTETKTIYTRYGDWFAWLSISCSVVFLFVAFLKKKHDLRSMS